MTPVSLTSTPESAYVDLLWVPSLVGAQPHLIRASFGAALPPQPGSAFLPPHCLLSQFSSLYKGIRFYMLLCEPASDLLCNLLGVSVSPSGDEKLGT